MKKNISMSLEFPEQPQTSVLNNSCEELLKSGLRSAPILVLHHKSRWAYGLQRVHINQRY
jgi:hypothetical protein